MAADFVNLDERTRRYMVLEITRALALGTLYVSSRLTPHGQSIYVNLLLEAARNGTPESLAAELRRPGRMVQTEERVPPNAGSILLPLPSNAAQILAEGEFNRLYMMALCRRAIDDGIPFLVVVRFRSTAMIWLESEARLGERIDPRALLQDLRAHPGETPELGIPPAPGSTLTVRLPLVEEVDEFPAGLLTLDPTEQMFVEETDPDDSG